MSEIDRLPPHSIEAEEAVLGSLLIDPDAIFEVSTFLKPESFYREQNRFIYEAIVELYDKREPLDFITLSELLKQKEQMALIGGETYLIDLLNAVPTSVNAQAYAHIVENAATRRNMIRAASKIANLAYDEDEDVEIVLDKAEAALFGISEDRTTKDLTPVKHIAREFLERFEKLRDQPQDIVGIPTGFTDLDRLLGGLNKSDLIIIASRPAMGKTSLALSMALTATRKHGKRVAIFNLEMSAEQLLMRMISAETRIDSQRLRSGKIYEGELPIFYEVLGRLSETRLYIDDTPGMTPRQMRTKCRRLASERGIDMVIIDYLQLMTADGSKNNRVMEISEISRNLKLLARELDVPLVALAQLSRSVESRQDKRPMLSDLRDSGSIEQDADIVSFIYRDEYYNPETTERPGIAELIIAKHRNGPTGTVDLYFQEEYATFRNLQRQEVNL
ncbi:MAG TPA: replicative DNA helicase [Anaerolineae bacterium]|nr:replicative DNA helicase [Anaerolineae bacterium]